MYLSLVIPAYNEANRVGKTLDKVTAYLNDQAYDAEIIVVDDGSRDHTAEVARSWQGESKNPIRVHRLDENRGKGAAVLAGMLEVARGEYRVFYDADASTPIEELEKVWPQFRAGADVVIGSRAMSESRIDVYQPAYREFLSWLYRQFLRGLGLSLPFVDTQCGFKAFTQAACDTIFVRQSIERFTFDVEILKIALLHDLQIVQVPVRWTNDPDSRVRVLTDSPRTLIDLLRIRLNTLCGRYR